MEYGKYSEIQRNMPPLYCEYVVEGIDYKTVQVALRDHILDEYEGNIRKSYMKKAKGKKS